MPHHTSSYNTSATVVMDDGLPPIYFVGCTISVWMSDLGALVVRSSSELAWFRCSSQYMFRCIMDFHSPSGAKITLEASCTIVYGKCYCIMPSLSCLHSLCYTKSPHFWRSASHIPCGSLHPLGGHCTSGKRTAMSPDCVMYLTQGSDGYCNCWRWRAWSAKGKLCQQEAADLGSADPP